MSEETGQMGKDLPRATWSREMVTEPEFKPRSPDSQASMSLSEPPCRAAVSEPSGEPAESQVPGPHQHPQNQNHPEFGGQENWDASSRTGASEHLREMFSSHS